MKRAVLIRLAAMMLCAIILYGFRLAGNPNSLNASTEQSSFKYLLSHPLHHVEAVCKEFECSIVQNDATKEIQQASFAAAVTAFDSGNSNRDSHALEVLDALEYPTVAFVSTSIATVDAHLTVKGELTFHGQTHPVTFTAESESSDHVLTVRGAAHVSLTAFGIERPSLLMIPVDDTLQIAFAMVFPQSGK